MVAHTKVSGASSDVHDFGDVTQHGLDRAGVARRLDSHDVRASSDRIAAAVVVLGDVHLDVGGRESIGYADEKHLEGRPYA